MIGDIGKEENTPGRRIVCKVCDASAASELRQSALLSWCIARVTRVGHWLAFLANGTYNTDE